MESLDDLILYGRENGCLDYKAKQYNKSKAIDLLKNIMAMANGAYEGDKFIIVGVRQEAGDRFVPVAFDDPFVDPSTYEQLIHQNIEPDINFEYFAHEIEGKKFGIFRIFGNSDRPYMMKKQKGDLHEGFCLIQQDQRIIAP